MQRAGYEHAPSDGDALGHEYRLSSGRRAVPHGSVGDFLTSELAHQSLKFKDCLQSALRDFCLVGRVRGQKFAALDKGVGDHGAQMIVNAGTAKTRVAPRILRGPVGKILNDLRFGEWPGQLQRFAQPITLGNAGKELVNRFGADSGKHFLALCWAFWEIAHQAEASLPLSAMKASYAAASISDLTSAGLARRTLLSQAPCGSELIFSGVFCRSALTSTTSPVTGA